MLDGIKHFRESNTKNKLHFILAVNKKLVIRVECKRNDIMITHFRISIIIIKYNINIKILKY